MKLSPKQAHYAFPIVMIALMTLILTGITGSIHNNFAFLGFEKWLKNWGIAYAIALPTMLLISPPLRRIIAKHTVNK